MIPQEASYIYHGTCYDVYDGDSIKVMVDLGFRVHVDATLRLYGIDAPEIRGRSRSSGLRSRDWLRERILHQDVIVQTYQDRKGKYGRWLATVYHAGTNINQLMVNEGLAILAEF